MSSMDVSVVHDYFEQLGGAERVALTLSREFGHAPIYTLFRDAQATFPADEIPIRETWLGDHPWLYERSRLASPLFPIATSGFAVPGEYVVCSSSGWAHGFRTDGGKKIVYCHNPARWLYQPDDYFGGYTATRAVMACAAPVMKWWDQRAARSADVYLANSTVVRDRIRKTYGIDAAVVHPPVSLTDGVRVPIERLKHVDSFVLTVSRLKPYKNVDVILQVASKLPSQRFAIVGSGPLRRDLETVSPDNVLWLGRVSDAELRWLYGNARLLLALSYEDFGLTPLEAAFHGTPTLALRAGGYLDTVTTATGFFVDDLDPSSIAQALASSTGVEVSKQILKRHARQFSSAAFGRRIRDVMRSI